MSDRVNPSLDAQAGSRLTAGAIRFAAAAGEDGWVVPAADSPLLADQVVTKSITTANLNAFDETSSGSSLDVDIDGGEAFVGGHYVVRDTTTTVTLDASTNDQDVFVGVDLDAGDTPIIGTSGDFDSDEPKIKLWTFDTDGSGVTSVRDQRVLEHRRSLGNIDHIRGASEPTSAERTDGLTWIHDVGNNVEFATWDDDNSEWELQHVIGPDYPATGAYGSLDGARWYHTGADATLIRWDGGWVGQGMSEANVLTVSAESLTPYGTNVSGSGSVSIEEVGLKTSSGGTDGSSARVSRGVGPGTGIFDFDTAFAFIQASVHVQNLNNGLSTIGIGFFQEDNYTNRHIAFKFDHGVGDVLGSVADGSTETTTKVVDFADGDNLRLSAVYRGGDEVTFHANGLVATISSGLPSGEDFTSKELYIQVSENNEAADVSLFTHHYRAEVRRK